ncbi:MAG: hypothetical protein WDA27_06895 [Actinomycetota bacterium]
MAGDPVLALIFDFDDTLVPDTTTLFLKSRGIDADAFWTEHVAPLVAQGYDATLAWLKCFLALVGEGRPLGLLTNADLTAFGAGLNDRAYSGLPAFFDEIHGTASGILPNARVEFYVISGGLRALIDGVPFVQEHFRHVYACELDEEAGVLRHIKRAVTFTEKTRYVFEINKGIAPEQSAKNPYLVNKDVKKDARRVPFANMFYTGDGLTDVPCISLIDPPGHAFGVLSQEDESKAKRAFLELLEPKRVRGTYFPEFERDKSLGRILHLAVGARCAEIVSRGE